MQDYQKILQLLLQAGTDTIIQDNDEKTAAEVAATQEIKDLINNWRPK